jgi:predicted amidohydrolase YtcJ
MSAFACLTRLACAPLLLLLVVACGGKAPVVPESSAGGPDMPAPVVADLVIRARRVVTLDPAMDRRARPPEALAVKAGRIVWIGERVGVEDFVGPSTQRLDLPGSTVVPGLVDSHAHLLSLGRALSEPDLAGATSEAEAIARVVAAAGNGSTWVEGRGWDQNDWPAQVFPTHHALSAAFPDRPVALRRVDGHALWANAAALSAAGITAATPAPPGGEIVRDAQGAPTGVLLDAAMGLVTRVIPPAPDVQVRRWVEAAIAACHRVGLTGVHDAGASDASVRAFEALAAEGALTLRTYMLLDADDPTNAKRLEAGPQRGDWLTVGGVKLFADGALGSRGAWLSAPYSDAPQTSGIPIVHGAALAERVRTYAARGFQLGVHAIGDAAATDVLNAYAQVLTPDNDRRFRLEHAQIVRPEDMRRMATLRVLALVQPTHATSDMPWAEKRLGPERIRWAYAWRSLKDAGVRLVLGSDFPVEKPDAMDGLYAAVTRQDASGQPEGGWYASEALTAYEALWGFTAEPAFAAFEEARRGRIAVGMDADLTVLGGDPLATPKSALRGLRVVHTIVGGRVVYSAPQ